MIYRYTILVLTFVCSLNTSIASYFFSISDLEQQIAKKKITIIAFDVEITKITGNSSRDTSADWTLIAQHNIHNIFEKMLNTSNYSYKYHGVLTDQPLVRLVAIQRIIEKSILSYFKNPLPSKKNFDWSMGSDSQLLKKAVDADYGLSVFIRAGFRHESESAGYQSGIISLVDLKTGKTVWFTAKTNLAGDLRDSEMSEKTILELLDRFPIITKSA